MNALLISLKMRRAVVCFLCATLILCIFPKGAKAQTETPPAPPAACAAQPDAEGNVLVRWEPPTQGYSAAITGFRVYYSADSSFPGAESGQWIAADASAASALVAQGLTKGRAYFFFVTAMGIATESQPTAAAAPATPISAPGAPVADTLLNENGAIMVNWLSPEDVGGTPVTAYTLTVSPAVEGSPFTLSGNTLSYTLYDLDPATNYSFSVTASNIAGTGPALTQTASPMRLRVSARATSNTSGSVTVQWGLKSETGEIPEIACYVVEYCLEGGGEGWCQEDAGLATEFEIKGLKNEMIYRIRIRAFTMDKRVLLSKTIQEIPEDPTEHIDCEVRSEAVPQGSIVYFTADNTAIREDMPDGTYYVPTSWKTNPEGNWDLQEAGQPYEACFSTAKIVLGSRPLTVTYTEYAYTQANGWGEPTGNTLTRSITYSIEEASQEVPATSDSGKPLLYGALALFFAAALLTLWLLNRGRRRR